jgi:hypothetical protein
MVLGTRYTTNGPTLTGDIIEVRINLRAPIIRINGFPIYHDDLGVGYLLPRTQGAIA